MWYERDDTIDIEEWKERVSGNGAGNAKKKKSPEEIKAAITEHVPDFETRKKAEVAALAEAAGIPRDTVRTFLHVLVAEEEVFEWKIKRGRVYNVHLCRSKQCEI